ncbi:MAG: ATP-binding protein [Chlorobi bacterium]|nr:ATP-binding protein [Chlorobiota bacterium]
MQNKRKIKIYSDTKYLPEVEKFINEIFEEFKVPHELYNKYYLCISEAVINSIEHGNRYDINKAVIIRFVLKKKYLKFIISDEGNGFDINNTYDPTTKENIKKEKGRGLYIIKSLVEGIRFKKNGRIIELKLKIGGKDKISQRIYSNTKH